MQTDDGRPGRLVFNLRKCRPGLRSRRRARWRRRRPWRTRWARGRLGRWWSPRQRILRRSLPFALVIRFQPLAFRQRYQSEPFRRLLAQLPRRPPLGTHPSLPGRPPTTPSLGALVSRLSGGTPLTTTPVPFRQQPRIINVDVRKRPDSRLRRAVNFTKLSDRAQGAPSSGDN